MSNDSPARWPMLVMAAKPRWLIGGALLVSATAGVVLAGGPVHEGPAAAAECASDFVIDFEGLPAGTIVGEQYDSYGVHISGLANGVDFPDAIIVFDSNASGTNDPDLEVDIGNIAIFANNLTDENGDGLVDVPDENNFGGIQIYEFDQPVHIGSFLFIDKDHGTPDTATAFDASGSVVGTATIPVAENGSVQTIDVDADNVSRLEIDYRDSAGLTGIEVGCPEAIPVTATPTPVVGGVSATPSPPDQPGQPVADTPAQPAVAVAELVSQPRSPVSLPATGDRPAPSDQPTGAVLLVLAGALIAAGAVIAVEERRHNSG